MKKLIIIFIMILAFAYTANAADCGVGDASCWNDTPSQCPTSYNEISCSAVDTDIVCGWSGSSPYCADSTSFSFTDPTVSTTDYTIAYDGGGVIDCFDVDAGDPFCDNTGAFWCDRNENTYDTEFRKTNCTGFGEGSYVAGVCRTDGGGYYDCDTDGTPCEIDDGASCGTATGTYNGCFSIGSGGTGNCTRISTRRDCNDDDSDSDENTCNSGTTCEVVDGAVCEANSKFETSNACYGSNGDCPCNTGYDDCDDDDGDGNEETGQSGVFNGCEIQEYVTNFPTGASNRYDNSCACACDANYKDCDASGCDAGNGCDYHYNVACAPQATNSSTCNDCGCDSGWIDCLDEDTDSDISTALAGGSGCTIDTGASCLNATSTGTGGTYESTTCSAFGGNCTSSGTYLDCDDSDGDGNTLTCNVGNGCEIDSSGSCTVSGLPGNYNGDCTCDIAQQDIGTTGNIVSWSGDNASLWLQQAGDGDSIKTNHSNGSTFNVNKSGVYFNGFDLSTDTQGGAGGGGAGLLIDNGAYGSPNGSLIGYLNSSLYTNDFLMNISDGNITYDTNTTYSIGTTWGWLKEIWVSVVNAITVKAESFLQNGYGVYDIRNKTGNTTAEIWPVIDNGSFQREIGADCPIGNYSYGAENNGTLKCRDDLNTGVAGGSDGGFLETDEIFINNVTGVITYNQTKGNRTYQLKNEMYNATFNQSIWDVTNNNTYIAIGTKTGNTTAEIFAATDNSTYIEADGSVALVDNWNQGAYNFTNTDSWFLGTIDCSMINGSDTDFCIDATGAGGGTDTNVSSICDPGEVLLGDDIKTCINLNATIDARDDVGNGTGSNFTGGDITSDLNMINAKINDSSSGSYIVMENGNIYLVAKR